MMACAGNIQGTRWQATGRWCIFATFVAGMGLVGCATQLAMHIQESLGPSKPRVVHIEACQDRTGFQGTRPLTQEATQILTEKVSASRLFEIAPDAPLILTCDIERFAEGSALKRWVMPGWGATQASIAVMVWDRSEGKVLATLRSQSSVQAGGLYTIGADQYILGVAFNDIIKQLETWVTGEGQAMSR
jgi:Domain of unknown function (DUF4410)